MKQYLEVMKDVLDNGELVYNSRTKTNTLTTLNHTLKYTPDDFPLVTTRKSYWKQAICEMLCYIRGYDDLRQFHSLGVHTWDANVKAWKSTNKHDNYDTGLIYGASAEKVGVGYNDILVQLTHKSTDRGIIWNFWNPEYFSQGCLRPCMYSHQFNVLDGKLHLTSIQRSVDVPLGLNFNMVQVWFLCFITAKLTDLEMGTCTHHLVNCHIYENQIKLAKEQVQREPFPAPKFICKRPITFNDVMYLIDKDNFDIYFDIEDYQYHPPIKYPFTV